MAIDIAEQICIAVDEIVSARLENIKYDTTINGTIVDNTDAKLYRYICSNGSSNFVAYGKDTTYKIGDSVQITIPNGDYDQQKIIIGKYIAEENNTPYIYIQPFDTMVDVSSNLINNNNEIIYGALLANEDYDNPEKNGKLFNMELPLWGGTFDVPQTGFNRLGLQGQFRSWISSLKPVKGDYGYRLEIFSENPEIIGNDRVSIKDWVELYRKVLWNKDNLNEQGLLNNTPESWYTKVMPKEEFIAEFRKKDKRIKLVRDILYANAQITTFSLESKDMYGNPYNFQSYFSQEAVFNIEKIEPIVGMILFFYETSNTFFNEKNEPIIYKNDLGNKLPANLYTKDPYICLGYSLEGFDKEEAILYSMNSKTYRFDGKPDTEENKNLNKKTVRLRWLHDFGENEIFVVNDDTDLDYEVRWYKYKLGNPSADEYSGVYWEYIENNSDSKFEFSFIPSYDLVEERIKAIVLYNGKIIRSNILIFTNEKEVANGATTELLAGLSIWCQDNSYGNYCLYGQNNDILKPDEALRNRVLEARFSDKTIITQGADIDKNASLLTEAQVIVWEFPLNNSMIIVDGFDYNYLRKIKEKYPDIKLDKNENLWYDIEQKEPSGEIYKLPGHYSKKDKDNNPLEIIKVNGNSIKIIRYNEDNKIEAHQNYRIEKTYAATKINNTIKCFVDKNGFTYSSSKELSFGLMGTNGTDATLVIDFNNNVSALTANIAEAVKITARLYDNNHNEVDFNNEGLNLDCEWSWAYYHQFSNEQEETLLANALADQGKVAEDLSYAELNRIRTEAVLAEAGESGVSIKTNKDEGFKNNPDNVCFLEHPENIPMDENGLFMILQAKVKGWGNYDLIAYKAIPIRATRNYRYIIGPSEVIYSSAGYIDYYKGPYELYYAETVSEYDTVPSEIKIDYIATNWDIYDPYHIAKNNKYSGIINDITNILQPAAMYFDDVEPYGAICYLNTDSDKKTPVWIQPLVILQNRYPSSTINNWDGKAIEINEEEGYIIAPAIAAGKKHQDDNTFSGVMIGDWSKTDTGEEISKQTGIYGFHHGAMSYAFKEDGTAFIGKSGLGRILFDGSSGTIKSSSWQDGDLNLQVGMFMDLDDGIIKLQKQGNFGTVAVTSQSQLNNGQYYIKNVGYSPVLIGAIREKNKKYYIKNTDNTYTELTIFDENWNSLKDEYIYKEGEYTGNQYYLGIELYEKATLYDSSITYYQLIGNNRYITLSADEINFPFSIGQAESPYQRNFRINWDGECWITNGHFTGDVEADNLFANAGEIGGWYISNTALFSDNIILNSLGEISMNFGNKNIVITALGYNLNNCNDTTLVLDAKTQSLYSGKGSLTDYECQGFFLNNEGFIVGGKDKQDNIIKITPQGSIFYHPNGTVGVSREGIMIVPTHSSDFVNSEKLLTKLDSQIYLGWEDTTHPVYDVFATPLLRLGGGGSSTNAIYSSGAIRKYDRGLWIGAYGSDNGGRAPEGEGNWSNPEKGYEEVNTDVQFGGHLGIFVDFSNWTIFRYENGKKIPMKYAVFA